MGTGSPDLGMGHVSENLIKCLQEQLLSATLRSQSKPAPFLIYDCSRKASIWLDPTYYPLVCNSDRVRNHLQNEHIFLTGWAV